MKPRPDILPSVTREVITACGSIFIGISFDEDLKPFEVFATMGKSGNCNASYINGIAIAISIGLRSGTNYKDYVKYLSGIRCSSVKFNGKGKTVYSCVDAIAKAIDEEVKNPVVLDYIRSYYA